MAFVLVFPFVNKTIHFIIFHWNILMKYIEDILWFDVEYDIHFMSETGFLIFSWVQSTCKNMTKSCLTSEINAIFNIKSLNFLFITFSLIFEHVSIAWNTWRDVTIACYFHTMKISWYFHSVKIAARERYHFYSMDKTQYFTALLCNKIWTVCLLIMICFILIM